MLVKGVAAETEDANGKLLWVWNKSTNRKLLWAGVVTKVNEQKALMSVVMKMNKCGDEDQRMSVVMMMNK